MGNCRLGNRDVFKDKFVRAERKLDKEAWKKIFEERCLSFSKLVTIGEALSLLPRYSHEFETIVRYPIRDRKVKISA